MRRLTYRVQVDAPESYSLPALVQMIEDALEDMTPDIAVNVEYHQIGTAEGLPDPEDRS